LRLRMSGHCIHLVKPHHPCRQGFIETRRKIQAPQPHFPPHHPCRQGFIETLLFFELNPPLLAASSLPAGLH